MNKTRVAELLDFAREEGFTLPMAPALIVWFEERNWIVDLYTGQATRPLCEDEEQRAGTPTRSGKAVNYLLTPGYGPDAIIPDYNPPSCDDTAAYDAYVKSWNDEWATLNNVKWWSRTSGK